MKKKLIYTLAAVILLGLQDSLAQLSNYYHEGFENTFPPAGWNIVDVSDPGNIWHRYNFSHLGEHSAFLSGSAGIPCEDWLILPQFSVQSTDSISFWLAVPFTGYIPDTTFIMVSTTDTALSSFTHKVAVLREGFNYPNTALTYEYFSYGLGQYGGENIYVAFKNKNTNGDGIFVDDVSIGNFQIKNASVESIDISKVVAEGTTLTPTATVRNHDAVEQSLTVTMNISGGYTSTQNVTNLPSGNTQQIIFDSWYPPASNYEVTVQTELSGDVYTNDDTLRKNVAVLSPFANFGWKTMPEETNTTWGSALATVVDNDSSYLVVAGGASFFVYKEAFQFRPWQNDWFNMSGMGEAVYVTSGVYSKGHVYVVGGYQFDGTLSIPGYTQIYDVSAGVWYSGAPMPIGAVDYAEGLYKDSLIYFIGGYGEEADPDSVQIYNPESDLWINGTPPPVPCNGWRGGITGNKIIVSGGFDGAFLSGEPSAKTYMGIIDEANPAHITWSQEDDYPAGAIYRPAAAASSDTASGLIVFSAGDPSYLGVSDNTFAFDVHTNTWKLGPAKPTAVNNSSDFAPIVVDDSLYMAVVGGVNLGGTETLDVNEWLNMGPYIITGLQPYSDQATDLHVFPNPFSGVTTVSFHLNTASKVKAVMTDLLGNEVAVLGDKNFPEGNHELKWNAPHYSSGIYFLKVYIGDKVMTKKVIKM